MPAARSEALAGGAGPMDDLSLNALDFALTSISNSTGYFIIFPPAESSSDCVYDLFMTTNLSSDAPGLNLTNWAFLLRTDPGQTNLIVPGLPADQAFFMLAGTNDSDGDTLSDAFERLVSHTDPLDADQNSNGIPDGWEWDNFGTLALAADADYDGDGSSILYEYNSGIDPNKIRFTVAAPGAHLRSRLVTMALTILGGVPTSMAVMVDTNDLTGASWFPYNPTPVIDLGTNEGFHYVWIGLRGRMATSQQSWQWTKLELEATPPQLFITNPLASSLSQPMVQVQGYCPEQLASLSYDLSNAAGIFTNQPVSVLDRYFDTNIWEFTTNTFQAFDVPLAGGQNVITLHGTDLAGNSGSRTLALLVDYSSKTNPPALNVYWPQDGSRLSMTTNYTLRGWVDDFTATVQASILDASGSTNTFGAQVERDGLFWIEGIPLQEGTNTVQITAEDAAGNVGTTNLTIFASPLALTVDYYGVWNDPNTAFTAIYGSIDSTNYSVWVNGVEAEIDWPYWTATNVPVPFGGSFVFQARAIPNTDNGGSGSGPLGPSAGYASLGNPSSAEAIDAEMQEDKPATIYLASYDYSFTRIVKEFSEGYYPGGPVTSTSEDDSSYSDTLQYRDSSTNNHQFEVFSLDWTTDGEQVGGTPYTGFSLTTWGWDDMIPYGADSGARVYFDNSSTNAVGWSGPPLLQNHCDQDVKTETASTVYNGTTEVYTDTHSEFTRKTQFKTMFFTGGKSVVGQSKLFAVTALVLQDLWNGENDDQINNPTTDFSRRPLGAIPWSATTVGSLGALGPDGYIYANLAGGQTLDLTPAASGVDYYEGGASATEIPVRIIDANTGNDITDQTNTVVVGQQVSLYALVQLPTINPNSPAPAYKWSVPGYAISNYVVAADASSAYVTSNFPVANSNLVFYWVDGATNRTLTCTATVGSGTAVGRTTFNVYRPSVTFTDTPPSWATNANGFLELGDTSGNMNYTIAVTSTHAGRADLTQLINRSAANGRTTDSTSGQYWADNYRFYRSQADSDSAFTVSTNHPRILFFTDGPGFELSHLFSDTTSIVDQFKDCVVYRPDDGTPANNIYVPLGRILWSWSASTTYSGDQWSPPTSNIQRPGAPAGGYEFPQWPSMYSNH